MLLYPFLKAFHIVGFVSWFAGLFYLVRMFVYHAEAIEKPISHRADWYAQFSLMQKRVYSIITTPAMVITWVCGLSMLYVNPALLAETWLQIKLFLLVLLVAYHFYCRKIMLAQADLKSTRSGQSFRLLNELPTLFLVAIVLLAVARSVLNFFYLFGGILVFGIILFTFVKVYKKNRLKDEK
jgi:protoporphyrinogen IX oxidase